MSDLTDTDFPALDRQPFVTEEGREIERLRAELAALVAERDSLKQRVAVLESQEFTLPGDPFRDPDRDLRERLVCAALTGLCADPRHDVTESVAVAIADRTLAAMRKE